MDPNDVPDKPGPRQKYWWLKQRKGRAAGEVTPVLPRAPIAELLHTARIDANLSRQVVADRAGVSRSTIERYETGRGAPSVGAALKVGEVLELSHEDVVAAIYETGRS